MGYVREVLFHTELKHLIEDTLDVPARYLTHNTYTVVHHSRALPLIIHSSDRHYLAQCRSLLYSQIVYTNA